jgi:hypothetical protein
VDDVQFLDQSRSVVRLNAEAFLQCLPKELLKTPVVIECNDRDIVENRTQRAPDDNSVSHQLEERVHPRLSNAAGIAKPSGMFGCINKNLTLLLVRNDVLNDRHLANRFDSLIAPVVVDIIVDRSGIPNPGRYASACGVEIIGIYMVALCVHLDRMCQSGAPLGEFPAILEFEIHITRDLLH